MSKSTYTGCLPNLVVETSTNRAKKINDTAIELAWEKGTKVSKYKYSEGKPDPDYKKALNKVYPTHNSWSKWQGKNGPAKGASCDVFAGTTCRTAGVDKSMPRGLGGQFKHLKKSSKWDEVKFDYKKPDLKAGDLVLYKRKNGGGHIMVIVEINGKLMIAEAAVNKYYGHINTSISKIKSKGSGSKEKTTTKVYRIKEKITKKTVCMKKCDERKAEVKKLQEFLNWAGFTCKIDGKFEDETEAAVMCFQEKNCLTVSGVVDDKFIEVAKKLEMEVR